MSVHPGANPSSAQPITDLPAPRLQLRWERSAPRPDDPVFEADETVWLCHYEIVLPLSEHDIRREIYKDGEQVGKRHELVVPLKGATRRGGGGSAPCAHGGTYYFDTPYRDGAHASWDSEALGGLPVFVIAPDGTAIAKPAAKSEAA